MIKLRAKHDLPMGNLTPNGDDQDPDREVPLESFMYPMGDTKSCWPPHHPEQLPPIGYSYRMSPPPPPPSTGLQNYQLPEKQDMDLDARYPQPPEIRNREPR